MSMPTGEVKRSLSTRAVFAWRGLAPFARPHRRALAPGILGAFGVVAARLAFPWPLRGVLELTLHQGGGRGASVAQLVPAGGDASLWLTGSFVVIIVVWALAEYIQRLSFARFAAGTVRDARDAAVKQLEAGRGSDRDPGDMLARIIGDSARLKSGIRGVLVSTTRNGIFFLGVSAIVLTISVNIGLVFIAGGLLSGLAAGVGAHKAASLTRRFRRRESALTSRLHHVLAATNDTAGSDDEPATLPGKDKAAGRPAEAALSRIEGYTTITIHLILAAATCAILLLAIDAGRTGALSPGSIFIILIYVTLMHNKIVAFGRMIVRVGRVVTSAERLASVTAPQPPHASSGPKVTEPEDQRPLSSVHSAAAKRAAATGEYERMRPAAPNATGEWRGC